MLQHIFGPYVFDIFKSLITFQKGGSFFKVKCVDFDSHFYFEGWWSVRVPILQISAPVVMIMRDLFGVLLRWWMVLEKKSNCSISKYRTGFLCVFPLSSSPSHIFMGNGSRASTNKHKSMKLTDNGFTHKTNTKTSLFYPEKGTLRALYDLEPIQMS